MFLVPSLAVILRVATVESNTQILFSSILSVSSMFLCCVANAQSSVDPTFVYSVFGMSTMYRLNRSGASTGLLWNPLVSFISVLLASPKITSNDLLVIIPLNKLTVS